MWRNARPYLAGLILGAVASGCTQPQNSPAGVGLTRACIESIAAQAMTNPRTNEIAANYAGPLGLVPTSNPNAPPWRSKQVEFTFSDGTMHYFAVEGPQWTKAVIIRVVPANEPRMRLFVMDREGTLLAAGLIANRQLRVLDVSDSAVRIEFLTEQALWRLAGADDSCGAS